MSEDLAATVDAAWDDRATIGFQTMGETRVAVERALSMLDAGTARVAEPDGAGGWRVNQWLKKAVLLSFRLNDNALIDNGPGAGHWFDKVPSKFSGWSEAEFRAAGFRAVPGSWSLPAASATHCRSVSTCSKAPLSATATAMASCASKGVKMTFISLPSR